MRINAHVFLRDASGVVHSFGPDQDIPKWAAKEITNKDLIVDNDKDDEPADPSVKPPTSGRGSGIDAWKAYATHIGAEFDDTVSSRDEIIALALAKEAELAQ